MGPPENESLLTRAWSGIARSLRWLVHLRGSPEAIGRGVSIGILVAFTPTVGFQIILTTALATFLNASRPAAVLMTAITSPPTMPPIYAFTYWVGSFFWAGPPVEQVTADLQAAVALLGKLGWAELHQQVAAFASIGREIFVPLWIGGVIVGGAAGAAAYAPVVRFVGFSRRRLARLRERRAARREARRKARP